MIIMLRFLAKSVVLYVTIVFVYRFMGKKEVGQLNISDLIVTLFVVELAAINLSEVNAPLWWALFPIFILVLLQFLLDFLSLKSRSFRRFIDGKPIVMIKDGKLNFSEMSKLRYSLDNLISQLREQGISSIEEVKYAVLENNGNLSVFNRNQEYPMPIILDGVIDFVVLKELHKDANWLQKVLKDRHLKLEDVFYAFYAKEKTFIITKKDLF